jgi:hypothetical protein
VLNAFDFRMLREITRACEDASWDDEIRVVVVTGSGRAFLRRRGPLKSWSADYLGKPREYWKWFGAFKDMHDKLREIGKPTLARINGIAVGGGNELQMACDLAVMVDDAVHPATSGSSTAPFPPAARRSGCRSWSATGRAREIISCASRSRPRRRRSGGSSTGWCRRRARREGRRGRREARGEAPRRRRYAKQQLNCGATSPGTRPSDTPRLARLVDARRRGEGGRSSDF